MKRKKKRKVNKLTSRQEQKASINHFHRQLVHYLKLIKCEELAELLDKDMCTVLYGMRTTYLPKLKFAPGIVASAKIKKLVCSEFDYLISKKSIEFNDDIHFSAKEVLQYLSMIELMVRTREQESFDLNKTRLIQQYNEKMPNFSVFHRQAIEEIITHTQHMGLQMSRMSSSICWLKFLSKPDGDEDRKIVFEINEHIPTKQKIIIDSHTRPVYPVSLALSNSGPESISIDSDKIRLPKRYKQPAEKVELPVLFQNHLLHRLKERLDCFDIHLSQLWLFLSLEDPKIVYHKGMRLVEFRAEGDMKLGYLVLDFHEDRLLVKTFLLLSNTGTPEGDKLKELSGLEKGDHQYWEIDKLSTFYSSDLKDNPKTRALFEQAGCGDLFNEISVIGVHDLMPSRTRADQILRYLEGAKDDGEMMTV